MAILYTATEGPNELFMEALAQYMDGSLTLDELEERVDRLEYIESLDQNTRDSKENTKSAKSTLIRKGTP